jgi:hypothetical protein
LYPGGSNVIPEDHLTTGLQRARAIRPLNAAGLPDPNGRYVLLSVGMSNTFSEFGRTGQPATFVHKAANDPAVSRSGLTIVNGAFSGETANRWESPSAPIYDRVRNERLAQAGVTERQVQIAWVKLANPNPSTRLPASNAEAFVFERQIGNVVRALRVRYPNLQQVFLSSRIYGGYGTQLNPEPYAYEYGFSIKWLIEAQIAQMRNGGRIVDTRAGDLNLATTPWLAWGPYMWANGMQARSDGLTWQRSDFVEDGIHPSYSGIDKVGNALLQFFKTSQVTAEWFLASGTTPTPSPTPSPTPTSTPTPSPTPGPTPSPTPSPTSPSPGPDGTAPTVSITSPQQEGVVSGAVTVSVSADDDVGVIRVELSIDGRRIATDLQYPYVFTWNSASVADGRHAIMATAYDQATNRSWDRFAVVVDN